MLIVIATPMMRVDHFVLHRNVIATKNMDTVTTGMVKTCKIINDAVNAHLIWFEFIQAAFHRIRRLLILKVKTQSSMTYLVSILIRSHARKRELIS